MSLSAQDQPASDGPPAWRQEFFTVDSALLRELGERLIGRPEIALAELVKNSYDADARRCRVEIHPDEIVIEDDGVGMTFDEFRRFWMRVGTTHKQAMARSRVLGRPLTGSKGVGRLAVQFLAQDIEILTRGAGETKYLQIQVDWNKAISAGDLTQAQAQFRLVDAEHLFAEGSAHGTRIRLGGLKQAWDSKDKASELAQQLWMLQPPFGPETGGLGAKAFVIDFLSSYPGLEEAFRRQMGSVLDNWEARLVGRLRDGRRTLSGNITLEFRDGGTFSEKVSIPDCMIDEADVEIRIFRLRGKQRHGVTVQDARDYLGDFGGVHIYDAGFRLPYYGGELDWLDVERDFAGRITASELLPPEFKFRRSLLDLPSIRNLFGSVRIDSGEELRRAELAGTPEASLRIQVTRDRLVSNDAFKQLKRFVRWGLDYYAFRVSVRKFEWVETLRPVELPEAKLDRVVEILEDYRAELPASVYHDLSRELTDYTDAVKNESLSREAHFGLLGPLATAGMAALALEHESGREMTRLERISRGLRALSRGVDATTAASIVRYATEIDDWISRTRASRRLFSALSNAEDREDMRRYRVHDVLGITLELVRPLVSGVEFEVGDIPRDALFPVGTMADWQSLLQNVFTNAANATLGEPVRRVLCSLETEKGQHSLRIEDTGVGVDLADPEALFEPFARRLDVDQDYRSLVVGGQGLGLAIVRMIAGSRRCSVAFVPPRDGYATCFEMTWSER